MSFQQIRRNDRLGRPSIDRITAFVVASGKARQGILQISASLQRTMGWTAGDRILIEVGSGEDAGRMRLSRTATEADGNKIRRGGVISIPPRYINGGDTCPATECPHVIVDGALIITLPAELRHPVVRAA